MISDDDDDDDNDDDDDEDDDDDDDSDDGQGHNHHVVQNRAMQIPYIEIHVRFVHVSWSHPT